MAATKTLTGTYEGPPTQDIDKGDPVEIVGFEHDNRGGECVWVVAGERVHCVLARYVRVTR